MGTISATVGASSPSTGVPPSSTTVRSSAVRPVTVPCPVIGIRPSSGLAGALACPASWSAGDGLTHPTEEACGQVSASSSSRPSESEVRLYGNIPSTRDKAQVLLSAAKLKPAPTSPASHFIGG